jgi:hypothetical protein
MARSMTTSTAEASPVFNEREQKLIWLGLNEAAEPGEVRNSAVKLLESLRRRGMRPETLILGSQLKEPERPPSALQQPRRRVMPFGKHRGRRLGAIEPSYLRLDSARMLQPIAGVARGDLLSPLGRRCAMTIDTERLHHSQCLATCKS